MIQDTTRIERLFLSNGGWTTEVNNFLKLGWKLLEVCKSETGGDENPTTAPTFIVGWQEKSPPKYPKGCFIESCNALPEGAELVDLSTPADQRPAEPLYSIDVHRVSEGGLPPRVTTPDDESVPSQSPPEAR